jgi:hypothetical protein
LIDTDVYFETDILERLFAKSPTQHSIGMLCAFGLEAFKDAENSHWLTQGHYFDTFAFVGKSNKPPLQNSCIFANCRKCDKCNPDIEKLSASGVIEVSSAFGGLAIVRSDLINNKLIRWKSERKREHFTCEHIAFCRALRKESGFSVAIDCDSRVFWDASTFARQ